MNVTSTGESGTCTLRAAITAAAAGNGGTPCGAVVAGGTTPINLPANTYTPTDGQIIVPANANISINGANLNNPLTTVIDGTGGAVNRIFEISSGASVTLSGLTVTGGRTPDSPVGPGQFQIVPVPPGGAIWNKGSLTIDHSVVKGNRTGNGSQGAPPLPENGGGGGGPGGDGGAIYNNDHASLTITNSKITDNLTGNGGNGGPGAMGVGGLNHNPDGKTGGGGGIGGNGGGIYNSNFGTLTIDNSTISGNDTGRGGNGGSGGQGAGPSPAPPPSTAEFNGGKGGDGGDGGNSGKQYRKDQAQYWDETLGGGGIYNLGNATITSSTISGNNTGAGGNGGPSGPGGPKSGGLGDFNTSGRAGSGGGGGRGGGLLNGSQLQGGMSLTNVTVTGNLTGDGGNGGGGGGGAASTLGGGRGGYGGDGGGIWAMGAHARILQMTHVTITKNFLGGLGLGGGSADNSTLGPGEGGRGAGIAAGGRYNTEGSGIYLRGTLIATNGFSGNPSFDKNCFQAYPVDQKLDITGQGNNLSFPYDGSPCPDLTNVDPLLGLLGDHGGPTETIVTQSGSAAIGGVPLAQCSNVITDQRGFPRPGADGVSCDIGAVETGSAPAVTPTTTNLISSANPSTPGQVVTFTATVSPPPSSEKVAFTDNGTTIPGCGVTDLQPGGQFTCQVTFPSAGSHSIVAAYGGNSLFAPSTSLAYSQTVRGGTPVDTTPPDTIIDSGPSGTIKTGSTSFTFHGTAGDTAKIQCRIDSGAYAVCISPKTYSSLGKGSHTASFRAQDAAGNQDATPATRTFTIDTSVKPPPKKAKISKVTIGGPAKVRRGARPKFKVKIKNSGNAAATGVKLKLSGGGSHTERTIGKVGAGKTSVVEARLKLNRLGRNNILAKVTSKNGGGKSVTTKVTVRR